MAAGAAAAGRLGGRRRTRAVDALISPEDLTSAPESPRAIALRRLRGNRIAQVAAVVFLMIVVLSFSAGFFERHWAHRGYTEQNLSGSIGSGASKREVVDLRGMPNVGPGLRTQYTLGADPLGRDLTVRVLRGGKTSLTIAFAAALLTMTIGIAFGTAAGYYRGTWDAIISRTFDVLLAFPTMVFAIMLSTALAMNGGFWFVQRGSVVLQVLIMGVLGGPYFGRVVRSFMLSLSEREFVEAARSLGARDGRIMLREMVPHLSTLIATYFGILVSQNLLLEAGLSFLGVGVLPPAASWGNIMADGKIFYATAWWVAFFPGLMIMVSVLCLNLVGEALEEAFDPKNVDAK